MLSKLSRSVMPFSLQPHGLQPTRLLCPWDFSGKDTGVGCHFLPQGIFPIQGSNPGLLYCRQILYWLSYKGSPYTNEVLDKSEFNHHWGKEESEKVGLKLNIQKTKIMASGPITSWEIDGETVETVVDFIFGAPESPQMVTTAMKLKDAYSLEGKLWPT